MKKFFTITTSHDVANSIEKFIESKVHTKQISFTIPSINYLDEYAVITVEAKESTIDPEDIFWLGYFTAKL